MNETLSAIIEPLGWALLHFLWQGTGIALLLAGFLSLAPRRASRLRYAAGCLALLAMVACVILTLWWPAEKTNATRSPAPAAATPARLSAAKPDATPPGTSLPVLPDAGPASHTLTDTTGYNLPTLSRYAPAASKDHFAAAAWLRPLLPWMVVLWTAGVAVFSLRLLNGWRSAGRWRSGGSPAIPEEWRQRFAELCQRLGLRRSVQLLSSAALTVPVVIGWLRPVVLVPAGIFSGLSAAQLEALLAHELAHVRRQDYLVNLVQHVLETLFFYHPAVWWVSRQIRQEREHCCDDTAAALSGVPGYARALAALEELRGLSSSPQAAPGVSAAGGSLLQRIRRLAGLPQERSGGIAGALGLLLLTAAVAALPFTFVRAAGEEFTAPQAAHISDSQASAYCVHDNGETQFLLVSISPFTSVTSSGANAKDRTWHDDGVLNFDKGATVTFSRRSSAPGKLTLISRYSKDGREIAFSFDLNKGRLFLLSPRGAPLQVDHASPPVTSAAGLATLYTALEKLETARPWIWNSGAGVPDTIPGLEFLPSVLQGQQVKLWSITIPAQTEDRTQEQQEALAREIRDRLLKGADFATEAREHSRDSKRERGGQWGWVREHDISREYWPFISVLYKGEISQPLLMENNYHLFWSEDRQVDFTVTSARPNPDVKVTLLASSSPPDPTPVFPALADPAKDRSSPPRTETTRLLKLWREEFPVSPVVPGEAMLRLKAALADYASQYPGDSTARLKITLLETEESLSWERAERVIDGICEITAAPVGRLAMDEEIRSFDRPKTGISPPAEELAKLPFGPAGQDGLRVAWVFDPAKDTYAVGDVVKCRIIFHNNGSDRVSFKTDQWHQNDKWTVTNAAGEKVEVKTTWFTGMTPWQNFTLEPGQTCEVAAHGAGIGSADYSEEHSTGAVGAEIQAVPGDEITCTWEVSLDTSWRKADENPRAATAVKPRTTGPVKFRVTAPDPNAPPKTGTALGTGRYSLAPGIKLQVTQTTTTSANGGTVRTNSATIEWEQTGRSHSFGLADGDAIDPIFWKRGSTVLWSVSGSRVRRVDFKDADHLVEEFCDSSHRGDFGGAPQEMLDELKKATRFGFQLNVPSPAPQDTPAPQEPKKPVTIVVGAQDQHLFDDEPSDSIEDLVSKIKALPLGTPVVIRAATAVAYQTVMTVLDACSDAGQHQVGLATMDSHPAPARPESSGIQWQEGTFDNGNGTFSEVKLKAQGGDLEERIVDGTGTVLARRVYTLDRKKQIRHAVVYSADGKPLGSIAFGYDDKSRSILMEERHFTKAGKLSRRIFYPETGLFPDAPGECVAFDYDSEQRKAKPTRLDGPVQPLIPLPGAAQAIPADKFPRARAPEKPNIEEDPFTVPADPERFAAARRSGILLHVMDSTGRTALKTFRVIAGVRAGSAGKPDTVNWQPHTLREGRNGGMIWPLNKAYDEMALRVEADGCEPRVYAWIDKKKGPQDLYFQLKSSDGIKGRVSTPDGHPATGAVIALGMVQRDAVIENGALRHAGAPAPEKASDRWRLPVMVTAGTDGTFQLPPETDSTAAVLITHTSGVREIPLSEFQKQPEVTLQPWGRIEGKVLWADKAGPNQRISLSIHRDTYGYPGVIAQYEKTQSGPDGTFVFERVLPGLVQLSCPITAGSAGSDLTEINLPGLTSHITVQPGANQAIMGGTGRMVKGKLTGPGPWEDVTFHFHPSAPFAGGPGDDEMWKAWSSFQSGPLGPVFFRNDLKVNADGTFEVTGVLPGSYQVFFRRPGQNAWLASGRFDVPAESPGQPLEPLDAGEFPVIETK